MRRLAVLACALGFALAACDDGGERRDPPFEDPTAPGEPSPEQPAPTQPAPQRVITPPVTSDAAPAVVPDCALEAPEDPPDVVPAIEGTAPLAWEYVPPDGLTVAFDGIQDGEGNLYWTEHPVNGGADAFVASATRDGDVRWRVPAPRAAPRALLVTAGRLVLTGGPSALGSDHPTWIGALDAAAGEVAWELDVAAEAAALVPADRGPMREGVRVDRPAVLGGTLTFPISAVDRAGFVCPGLLRVDAASGAVPELRRIAVAETIWIPGEPAASPDTTFVTVSPDSASRLLVGFDAAGAPSVVVPEPFEDNLWIEAATDLWVFQSGLPGGIGVWGSGLLQWSAPDGTPRGRLAGAAGPTLVATGDTLTFAAGGRVASVDLAGCAVRWARTLARVPPLAPRAYSAVAEAFPILTTGGGVLLSHQVYTSSDGTSLTIEPGPGRVVELGPDGAERYRARLPDGLLRGGGAALHAGRWFVSAAMPVWQGRIQAFDLAGQEPAEEGWVTRHGTMTRERRTR